MEQVGGDEGEVAGQQRDRDLDRRVVDPAPDLADDVTDGEADGEPAADDAHESQACVPRARTCPQTAATIATRSATSAVASLTRLSPSTIDDEPPWHPEPARDRGRRDRVGGRDDGAERERRRPAEADHAVGDDGDGGHRHQHEPDREQADRPRVRAQVAERGEERGGVEERRQDADEHELGLELEGRDPRREPEREAAEHEQDRVGDSRPRREREQRCRRRQEAEQNCQVMGGELVHRDPMIAERGVRPTGTVPSYRARCEALPFPASKCVAEPCELYEPVSG